MVTMSLDQQQSPDNVYIIYRLTNIINAEVSSSSASKLFIGYKWKKSMLIGLKYFAHPFRREVRFRKYCKCLMFHLDFFVILKLI